MSDLDLQNVVDAFMENAAIVDEAGIILFVNKSWATFSKQNNGKEDRTNIGANYFSAVEKAANEGDIYAQNVRAGIRGLLSKKSAEFELEYPCHSKDQERWFIASIKEINHFKPRKFLFTHKDVTSLVLREKKIRNSQRREAIGQLAGGIAHDFNNILMVVMGNLQRAKDKLNAGNPVNEYLDYAWDAAKRGAELVEKLLQFSRDKPVSLENIDANEFIRETLKMIARTLGEDIRIETRFSNQSLPIQVDPGNFASSILNIAINARHAMPGGGVLTIYTARVNLDGQEFMNSSSKIYGPHVLLSIKDTGCGIPEHDLDRVLEPFFTTREVGEGSGLGLSMVFGFISQSNAYINIESYEREGTTVSIYFPLQEETSLQDDGRTTTDSRELQGGNILIVEDDEQVRKVFVYMLQQLGYQVIQAQNGSVAQNILNNKGAEIDIVITDVVLPEGTSGLDLAEEIGRTYPAIKVLLTSGYPDKNYQKYSAVKKDESTLPLLIKPFSQDGLIQALKSLYKDPETSE